MHARSGDGGGQKSRESNALPHVQLTTASTHSCTHAQNAVTRSRCECRMAVNCRFYRRRHPARVSARTPTSGTQSFLPPRTFFASNDHRHIRPEVSPVSTRFSSAATVTAEMVCCTGPPQNTTGRHRWHISGLVAATHEPWQMIRVCGDGSDCGHMAPVPQYIASLLRFCSTTARGQFGCTLATGGENLMYSADHTA